MKTKLGVVLLSLVSSLGLAQQTAPAPGIPGTDVHKRVMIQRRELGAWWKNSKIADKLQLSDSQVKQLEDAFYQHKMKLIDYQAEMEKADMKLQQNLNADNVDESQVNTQVDQVLAARAKVEREMTMMHLDMRKILSTDQWKQLQSLHGPDTFFFVGPGGMTGGPVIAPLPPQSELIPESLKPDGADCKTTEKNGMKVVMCTKQIELYNDTEHEL